MSQPPSPQKNTWGFSYRQTQYIRTMLSIFQLFVYFRRQTCCLMIIVIYFLPLILLKWLPQTFRWKAGWCTSLLPTLSVYETLHLHVLDYVVFSSNQDNLLLWYVGFLNWWKLQSSFISSFPQIYHLGNYISQGKMNFCKFSSHKLTARFFSCFLELLKKNSFVLFCFFKYMIRINYSHHAIYCIPHDIYFIPGICTFWPPSSILPIFHLKKKKLLKPIVWEKG